MSEFKIIFSDIDGTLLNSHHKIPARTAARIKELTDGGMPFVLVSARMPDGIFHIQQELGIRGPIVCYSGALILGERREVISSIGFRRQRAVEMKRFVGERHGEIVCTAYSHNQWVVDDAADPWVVKEWEIAKTVPTAIDLSQAPLEGDEVHKLFCMGDPRRLTALEADMKRAFPDMNICKSTSYYLEVENAQASKSGAVRTLCRQMDISTEQALSFGDNYNDLDMLLATEGYAMGNAPPGVRLLVPRITLDNDSEGMLQVLNRIFPGTV